MELGDPEERLVEKLKASFNTTGFVKSRFNGSGSFSGYNIEKNTIGADKIITDELVVGTNIAMGPNATIEWANVLNAPSIPTLPSYIQSTKITSTTIESPHIIGGDIKIGSGTSVFKADANGIYLGNETFSEAPFRVTPEGNMTANNAIIQGTFKTSDTGARIEINAGGIISYNSSESLHGLVVSPGYADIYLYYYGTPIYSVKNIFGGVSMQYNNIEYLSFGSNGAMPNNVWDFSLATIKNLNVKAKFA